MSSARRPLLTATAAATLLGALWFVPSANASQEAPARTVTTTQVTTQARAASATTTGAVERTADRATDRSATRTLADAGRTDAVAETGAGAGADDGVRLADTGSFDTTPYVVGGTTLLALGAGFVVYSIRRERLGF
ncbi:LPXTG cell wall anchor domain-containing protein [Streptomyces sp. AK04-3B]|uniref:LPXTG cell wall anchor domain-containing protein n=1 Tax=unclassified Streptomyces TaxID=2593676 RepID=UPI0029A7929C|nr:LPXTG cell wall anchor domain-containing protein [Streptomyces sp. AK04-3B]MDX3803258.1 LPXTG cell wall anchor domain-containing protein [Streptomyces sp. AK04-3B]